MLIRSTGTTMARGGGRPVKGARPVGDSPPKLALLAFPMLLVGPPGSGKSTIGKLLATRYDVPMIAMSKLLREEVAKGGPLADLIKSYMDKGELVPAEIVMRVLETRLSAPDIKKGFLLDGSPRRLVELHLLEQLFQKRRLPAPRILSLRVGTEEILQRIANRRYCASGHEYNLRSHPPKRPGVCDVDSLPLVQRTDDTPEVVKHRLDVFKKESGPILREYAAKERLWEVDGERSPEEVLSQVTDLIEKSA